MKKFLGVFALSSGFLALLLIIASGPGYRLGWLDWPAALLLLKTGATLGLLSVPLIIGYALWSKPEGRRVSVLATSAVVGLFSFYVPFSQWQNQRTAYPAPEPVVFEQTAREVFEAVQAVVDEQAWAVREAQPPENGSARVEATATTFWFGFQEGMTVLIQATPEGGSRVETTDSTHSQRAQLLMTRLQDHLSTRPPGSTASAAVPDGFKTPNEQLITGGQPSREQLQQMKAAGVTTVINLRGPGESAGFDEQAEAEALGLRYIALPINGADDITPDNARKLDELLNGTERVLLHCASGNRAGALLALRAYRLQDLSEEEALQLGQEAGLTSLEERVKAVMAAPR
ncbi:fused DSP-PTPase phosphatase/NAD kinase-like protein [Marinimicrobium sp. ARAG 43.8]|uniref:fused DSP-PTPase phosphatase/NAD kinase-like protein n=1 Tax=Marinimicrobium sp. ARAG 43.8 TaxID=3418719 RepID=UPI003CEA0835